MLHIPLDTTLGPVTLYPIDPDHICISAETDRPLTVNAVKYRVAFHVFKQADGTFTARNYQDLYLRRAVWNGKDDSPSASATKKTTETLTAAVNAWVAANPVAMEEARQVFLANEITKRNETIAAKRAAIAALEAEITDLMDQAAAVAKEVK